MIEGREPYTVPLFGPQGDVEKPVAVPPVEPAMSKAPWAPPAPAGTAATTGAAEKMPWEAPVNGGPATAAAPPRADSHDENPAMQAHEIKARIHKQLIERLNLSNLDSHDRETVVAEIRRAVQDLLARDAAPLNFDERERLVEEVLHEIFGLGPLEPLLQDPTVSDILVNTYSQVYVERNGKIERTDVRFKDNRHLLQVIDRIVSAVGRRIDDSSPMVDARLADGSRVNAVIPPLSIDGPHVSIRKFKKDALSSEDLLRVETITPHMLDLLQGIVKARLNVLISGGTGSGKTTLLNVLSSSIPANE